VDLLLRAGQVQNQDLQLAPSAVGFRVVRTLLSALFWHCNDLDSGLHQLRPAPVLVKRQLRVVQLLCSPAAGFVLPPEAKGRGEEDGLEGSGELQERLRPKGAQELRNEGEDRERPVEGPPQQVGHGQLQNSIWLRQL